MSETVEQIEGTERRLEVQHPDLCRHFSSQREGLSGVVTPPELSTYLDFLLQYPYFEVVHELKECALDRARMLTVDKLSRLEQVLQTGMTNKVLLACREQEISPGYQFHIIPQGGDYKDLLTMMNTVPNCVPQDEKDEVARRIQEDIDLGACVKIFGLDAQGTPQMYLRYYITVGKSGEPFLQIDAVEGGTKSYWTKVGQWTAAGRGKELLYGISTSLLAAERLGIQNIVLGDFESDELGKMLGCRRIRVYGPDVRERKIGLPPRIARTETLSGETAEGEPFTVKPDVVLSPGVFANRLTEDSYQRVLARGYRSLPLADIHEQTVKMIAEAEQSKYHSRKKRELQLLHEATASIQLSSGKSFTTHPLSIYQ